jgi:6-phosphogluconate dehydrogenase
MGQNPVLNMADNGFTVCEYNTTTTKVDYFLQDEAKGKSVSGAHTLEEMVSKLKIPRRVILLVKAGSAVDDFIKQLVPLLQKGDIIIDGGNSEYQNTSRRCKELKAKGFLFVGSGVSGEEGPERNRLWCRADTSRPGMDDSAIYTLYINIFLIM